MPLNTPAFVIEIIQFFEAAEISLWLFGGWAEELWQLIPPGSHHDIDFLYPENSFQALDRLSARTNDFQEISSKRFSHKRAIIYQDVMLEFLLVKHGETTCFTDFFSGRYRLEWPADLLRHSQTVSGYDLPIASKQALRLYRQHHTSIEQAYQDFAKKTHS